MMLLLRVIPFCFLMILTLAFPKQFHDSGYLETSERCVCLKKLKTGLLNNPIAYVPIDKNHFLLAEQSGRIYLYFDGKYPNRELVIDMKSKSAFTGQPIDEKGLLSIAVHPDFEKNHRFYVYYISNDMHQAIISEFVLSNELPLDLSSERKILVAQRQVDSREHGGQIFFGIDKMLYISVGAGMDEWESSAQNKFELTGKILRIEVDSVRSESNKLLNTQDEEKYSVPSDNPFRNITEAREEIYALGVKNMWRCSIDRGDSHTGYGKGRIFCGDVGLDSYEEINIIKKGGNYGWNLREGYQCRQKHTCNQTLANESLPIYVYEHDWTRKAVIGGYVYRGTQLPWLNGQYIFADFLSLELFRLEEVSGAEWKASILPYCSPSKCEDSQQKYSSLMQYILSFGEDLKGEHYLLVTTDLSGTESTGAVLRISAQIRNHSHRPFFSVVSGIIGVAAWKLTTDMVFTKTNL